MAGGRPTRSQIVPPDAGTTWIEILVLDSNDRLKMSADVARQCQWLTSGNEILAVLRPGNLITLLPYETEGRAVEDQFSDLIADESATSLAMQLALRQRYLRLRVNDARMPVPKDVRLCLGLDPVSPTYVILVIRGDRVTLEPPRSEIYEEAEDLLSTFDLPY